MTYYEFREVTAENWEDVKPLLEELQLFHYDLCPDVYTPTVKLDQLHYLRGYFGYGCYTKDRCVGLCWGYINTNGRQDPVGFVDDFIVNRNYRNRGIGRSLLSMFEGACKIRGAKYMELLVNAENKNAIELYEEFGMSPLSIHMRMQLTVGGESCDS